MAEHSQAYDVLIVGGGIVGLAHAYRASVELGLRVCVVERNQQANGASIRNFGALWPIGLQPELRPMAIRSKNRLVRMMKDWGLWHREAGSIHLAYHEDERAVLGEFLGQWPGEWLDPEGVLALSPGVKPEGLLGGMFSASEVQVDAPTLIRAFTSELESRAQVDFKFGTTVTRLKQGMAEAGEERIPFKRAIVCSGAETGILFPEWHRRQGTRLCKLQMMATGPQPKGFHLGPLLVSGLSLRHYSAFESCAGSAQLRARVLKDWPSLDDHGIHVMVAQDSDGALLIGDSHHYGESIRFFDLAEVEALILSSLSQFFQAPDLSIKRRWSGTYLKHPDKVWIQETIDEGIDVAVVTGGIGMTVAFGLAEASLP